MNNINKVLQRWYLTTLGKWIPTDVFASKFPVSVKGIIIIDNKVVLLKNERQKWDLPGGKLKKKEQIEECLIREFSEELNASISVKYLLGTENIKVYNLINVLIVIFFCETKASFNDLKISHESFGLGQFSEQEIEQINLPKYYLPLIRKAFEL